MREALAAIDDDSPRYGEPLARLLALEDAERRTQAEPELLVRLMVELRKLRPTTLWVRDTVERALAVKQQFCLDGALCRLDAGGSLPPPSGRECWLELQRAELDAQLPTLPAGWGVVVAGELAGLSFSALRKRSPLRALGVILEQPLLIDVSARLDLVVQPANAPVSELGARVLTWGADLDRLALAEASRSGGLVCDGDEAFTWVLRLATKRR